MGIENFKLLNILGPTELELLCTFPKCFDTCSISRQDVHYCSERLLQNMVHT